jgi:hypothetical protein
MRDRVAGNAFTYFVGGVSQERIGMHTSAESSIERVSCDPRDGARRLMWVA